ncbi:MAG: metallophosphoesterase [Phycisphaerales bacterium]|nr:metallophosphoesterase [Phycisphaerales bacterium]
MPNLFRWLHLTDFHLGCSAIERGRDGVEHAFWEDLQAQSPDSIQLVVLSGDFIDRCDWRQDLLGQLNIFVRRLKQTLPAATFVAVPGNHDFDRGQSTEGHRLLGEVWNRNDLLRSDFFGQNPREPLRNLSSYAFEAYCRWWSSENNDKEVRPGWLPGEFRRTVTHGRWRIGVAGLNTAFLAMIPRRADVDLRQLERLAYHGQEGGPRTGQEWCASHHLCILVTHHPGSVLSDESVGETESPRRTFYQRFLADGHFQVHLCGDLHETAHEVRSIFGSRSWHCFQGGPLFGEPVPNAGWSYSIGEIDWGKGELRRVPRVCYPSEPRFVADEQHFYLDGVGTRWQSVEVRSFPGSSEGADRIGDLIASLPALGDNPRPFEILIPFRRGESRVEAISTLRDQCEALVEAGKIESALRLLAHRLIRPVYFYQGAFAWGRGILETILDSLAQVDKPGWKAWTLDALGNFVGRLGRPAEAVDCYGRAVAELKLSSGPPINLAIVLGNRFLELVRLGRLKDARVDENERIKMLLELERAAPVTTSGDEPTKSECQFHLATAYLGSAYWHMLVCNADDVDADLKRAAEYFEASGHRHARSFLPLAAALTMLSASSPDNATTQATKALELARQAEEFARDETDRDRIRAGWALGLAQLASARAARDDAMAADGQARLVGTLKECRQLDLQEIEPDILIALSSFRHADARKARDIAERCGYVLKQADAHIAIAQGLRPGEEFESHLRRAEDLAKCDGPGFRYEAALRKVRALRNK